MGTVAVELLKGAFITLLLYCSWSDLQTRRIPNCAVLLLLLCAIAQSLLTGIWLDWKVAAMALVVGFGVFLLGCFGAGDIKYFWACMMAVPNQVDVLLVSTAFAGLVLALIYLAKFNFRPKNVGTLPYGVAISFGLFLCLTEAVI